MDKPTIHKFEIPPQVDFNNYNLICRRECGIRSPTADKLSAISEALGISQVYYNVPKSKLPDANYIGKTVAECRQLYDNVRITSINGVAQIGIQNMDTNRLNLTVVGQCNDLGQNPCYVQTHCVDSLVVTEVSWY